MLFPGTATGTNSTFGSIQLVVNKKKTIKAKGKIFNWSGILEEQIVRISIDGTNIIDFSGVWNSKKTSGKNKGELKNKGTLTIKNFDTFKKGKAKVLTSGKNEGDFIIIGKRYDKIEPINGSHSVRVQIGTKVLEEEMNFIKGKAKKTE